MAFILSPKRDEDTLEAFASYRRYLAESRPSFPSRAYELATSDWYFDFREHRCPHDGWLESLNLTEQGPGVRSEHRHTSLRIRLLGAFHDGVIEFSYPRVFHYSLSGIRTERGLGDWRYDEFRVSPEGHVIHEIEWGGSPRGQGSRWLIEASDVEFHWEPK